LVKRQRNGVWTTTTANVWGSLALESYAKAFEREAVAGASQVRISNQTLSADWSKPAPSLTWNWSPPEREATAVLSHKGSGKPYAIVALEAAIPITEPVNAGYKLNKTLTPVSQAQAGKVQVGDVFRVDLDIVASQAMTWVAVFDPIPAGATILGGGSAGGLRSSEIEQTKSSAAAPSKAPNWDSAWPAFEEMRFDSYRSFYEYMPAGKSTVTYTIRVSQAGVLKLPSTRVEAMYSPSVYGEWANTQWTVHAR
jgi:alpha-2-macroglobulin